MPTFRTPVTHYTGEAAGVQFVDGEGHTDNPHAADWLARKGYRLVDDTAQERTTTPTKRPRKPREA